MYSTVDSGLTITYRPDGVEAICRGPWQLDGSAGCNLPSAMRHRLQSQLRYPTTAPCGLRTCGNSYGANCNCCKSAAHTAVVGYLSWICSLRCRRVYQPDRLRHLANASEAAPAAALLPFRSLPVAAGHAVQWVGLPAWGYGTFLSL